jgi:hypothetical protein
LPIVVGVIAGKDIVLSRVVWSILCKCCVGILFVTTCNRPVTAKKRINYMIYKPVTNVAVVTAKNKLRNRKLKK